MRTLRKMELIVLVISFSLVGIGFYLDYTDETDEFWTLGKHIGLIAIAVTIIGLSLCAVFGWPIERREREK